MKKILIVDDDESILLLVSKYLTKSGYTIVTERNGKDALSTLRDNEDIALIITDIVMPFMDGVELCRTIRGEPKFERMPILMLTSMSDISNKYMGFDSGADDYLTKPFEPLELLLRVQSLLKKYEYFKENKRDEEASIENPNAKIKIDKKDYSVHINNKSVYLTLTEFDILYYLYQNFTRPVPVEELLQKVMGYPPRTGNPEIIRTHIKNIRAKIEDESSENPKVITTVPRRGYLFNKELA